MILNQAQAEAVYSAMCALNNVSVSEGTEITFVGTSNDGMARYTCSEYPDGQIEVDKWPGQLDRHIEFYANQAAFATAYGLQQG